MNTFFQVFTSTVAALFSTVAFGYSYEIYNVPQSIEGVPCQQKAVTYGENLEAEQGVTVQGAACLFDDLTNRYQIKIRYDAQESLTLVSTYTFGSTYDSKGIYPSYEACTAALPEEENLYRAQTGLDIFVSFCSHDKWSDKRPWYAHIDGFGDARNVPHRTSWRTHWIYGLSGSQLYAQVKDSMEEAGLDLVHLTIRPAAYSGSATVFYYGPKAMDRASFSASHIATIPGLEDCQRQAANLLNQATISGRVKPVTVYCSSPYSNPSRFDLTLVLPGMTFLQNVFSTETFADLPSCLASEAQIGATLNSVLETPLIAAICGKKLYDGSFRSPYRVIGIKSPR